MSKKVLYSPQSMYNELWAAVKRLEEKLTHPDKKEAVGYVLSMFAIQNREPGAFQLDSTGEVAMERVNNVRRLKVAEVCLKKSKKMAEVAEALDVDYQTVLYWNQGRAYPTFKRLLALCRELGCKLEELL